MRVLLTWSDMRIAYQMTDGVRDYARCALATPISSVCRHVDRTPRHDWFLRRPYVDLLPESQL